MVWIEADGPELAADCAAARAEIRRSFDELLDRARSWDLPAAGGAR